MTRQSDSPPPTPPSRAAGGKDEWRFQSITSPCEWIENYHPGGYHPVHLGDTFKNGQYRILRKLGEGSFSTVWLARDAKGESCVALKILMSNAVSSNELQILRHLASAPDCSRYITTLLDEFEHTGPNGTHTCLVFEAMGPNVNTMVEELPQFKPRTLHMVVRYPPKMAKRILKQALEGLAFLHKNGIAHGDFHPGNMLFSLKDVHDEADEVLGQSDEVDVSISPRVVRIDGKQDKWAPRYLCIPQPMTPFTDYGEGLKIKLSDVGGAYFFTDPPAKPVTPAGLRAPELILKKEVNNTLDIWSFGCLVFELMTGRPLFCVPWYEDESYANDDHLLTMNGALGPLPDDLYQHWNTASRYFTKERKLYNCELGAFAEGAEPLMLGDPTMEQMFDEARPELDEKESKQIKKLIRRILHYDSAKRPTPSAVLRDPWFVGQDEV